MAESSDKPQEEQPPVVAWHWGFGDESLSDGVNALADHIRSLGFTYTAINIIDGGKPKPKDDE